jgi:hypothetical protein
MVPGQNALRHEKFFSGGMGEVVEDYTYPGGGAEGSVRYSPGHPGRQGGLEELSGIFAGIHTHPDAFIDRARNRHREFEKRLRYFIHMTEKNKQFGFGGIEKYY